MKTYDFVKDKSQPVIDTLTPLREVKGIVCFGSYAMGTADARSDIDLYVFCEPTIIPSSIRSEKLNVVDGIVRLEINHANFGWDNQWAPQGDELYLNDIQFDITYNTLTWLKRVVERVKEEGATSIPEMRFRPYTMLGLLDNSIVLYDPYSELVNLIAKLYPYPSQLRKNLISENWPIVTDSLEELRDYVQRNIGPAAFHFHLRRLMDALTNVIFAISEKYDPATKRIEEFLKTLNNLPPRLLDTYIKILKGPFDKRGRQMTVKYIKVLMDQFKTLIEEKTKPGSELDFV